MLQTMKRERGNPGEEEHVFVNSDGTPERYNLNRALAKCVEASGIDPRGACCHAFRYTCGTLLIRQGADVKKVQRFLRHQTASMTLDIYAQYFEVDLFSVAKSLSAALKEGAEGKSADDRADDGADGKAASA